MCLWKAVSRFAWVILAVNRISSTSAMGVCVQVHGCLLFLLFRNKMQLCWIPSTSNWHICTPLFATTLIQILSICTNISARYARVYLHFSLSLTEQQLAIETKNRLLLAIHSQAWCERSSNAQRRATVVKKYNQTQWQFSSYLLCVISHIRFASVAGSC